MSSFWDAFGQRINEGSITKREMLNIIQDLHSIDHAMDEMISHILYEGYPNWLSNNKEERSHDGGLGEMQIKKLIKQHQKIRKRYDDKT